MKHPLKTPLGRVRGLGSAKEGTEHWLGQRFSAIALFIMGAWFLYALMFFSTSHHTTVVQWAQEPLHTLGLGLFLFSAIYHARLGVQVIIEDYVHCEAVKLTMIIALRGFAWVLAAVGAYALLILATAKF